MTPWLGADLGFFTFFFFFFSCIVYLTLMSRRTREPLHTIIFGVIFPLFLRLYLLANDACTSIILYSLFVSPAGVGGFDGGILRVVSWTDSFAIHENSITQE